MKAIVMEGPGRVLIKEMEMPRPKKGEALLKLLYGGICGSDLSSYRGTMKFVEYPRVPGHEFSAQVIEAEENDRGIETGMYVTANPYFNCGHCYSCRNGLVNCCTTNQTMGLQREGAFSEYITMPIDRLYPGEGLSPKTLSLIEPFCIGYHGIKRANIQRGDKVLVIGAGTIGLLAAMAAIQAGGEVTICDVAPAKLQYAEPFGVHHTICNSSKEAFADGVRQITGGDGFDVTVEAVGLAATFQDCIDAACFGGRMIQLGVSKQNADLFFTAIQQKELTIRGSRNAVRQDFMEAIEMLKQGSLEIDDVVTHVYPMDRAADAFEDFHQNTGDMLKVLIQF